jgi:hypothetical protein
VVSAPKRHRILLVALVGLALTSVSVLAALQSVGEGPLPPGQVPYVRSLDDTSARSERLLIHGDGQFFAMLARDPALRRPSESRSGDEAFAYRAQRPLFGHLGWALSGGDPDRVPVALLVASLLGGTILVAGAAAVRTVRGASPWPAVLAALLPGTMLFVRSPGPEPLAAGLALLGVAMWQRDERFVAVACLVVAGLLRESTLLVAAALIGAGLLPRRGQARMGARVRAVTPLLAPFVIFGFWVAVIRAQVGAWPWSARSDRLAAPFTGLWDAAAGWRGSDVLVLAVIVGLGALAWTKPNAIPGTRWILGAHVGFALVMGAEVWRRYEDFGRPLLPATALSLAIALPDRLSMPRARSRRAPTPMLRP